MRFQRSYQHAFEGPTWRPNLLYCSACALVPFAGWAALIGYGVESLEAAGRPAGTPGPSFEPGRLRGYLARGLWPATVQLLAVVPSVVLTAAALVLVSHLQADPKHSASAVRAVASVLAPCLVLLAFLQTVVLLPLTVYTGLGGVGNVAAAWEFTLGFLRRVGRESFLAQTFMVSTGLALGVVGAVPCFVGLPPALALATLAQYHLMAQLYGLYLQRGGAAVAAFGSAGPPTERGVP